MHIYTKKCIERDGKDVHKTVTSEARAQGRERHTQLCVITAGPDSAIRTHSWITSNF